MRVFIYEYITGGGLFSSDDPHSAPSGSLLAEGTAMAQAVMADFAALEHVHVTALRDARLAQLSLPAHELIEISNAPSEMAALASCAGAADWVLLIAPEFDGVLADRARLVEQCGGRLLSPGSDFAALASDKHKTAQCLQTAGVATPSGVLWSPAEPFPDWTGPLVAKPREGAGSRDVRLLASVKALGALPAIRGNWRLEPYCPGAAVSVAFICGPQGPAPLPAMRQNLSSDGRFTYLGGGGPLEEPLQRRAQGLAMAAVSSLPPARGYIGVDLVLGDDPDGADDAVIEINPRLTTSYVGLRQIVQLNLAAAMLAAVAGEELKLTSTGGRVEFTADGRARIDGMAAVD